MRLDLPAIEAALAARAAESRQDPAAAYAAREDARRMAAGYAYVDAMLAEGADPLAFGQSQRLLELNHIVLCGLSPARRAEHVRHIAATETRFYGDHEAGADAFYDWLETHRGAGPGFAARLYVRIVSSPQLFLEGNQRTAVLCASHALVAAGAPPLVVDAAFAPAFAPVAQACRAIDRRRLAAPLRSWLAAVRLGRLLAARDDTRYVA